MKPGFYRLLFLLILSGALPESSMAQQFSEVGRCDTFSIDIHNAVVHWQIIQNNEHGQLIADANTPSFIHCWEQQGSYLLLCEKDDAEELITRKIEVEKPTALLLAEPQSKAAKGAKKDCQNSLRKIEFTACSGSYVRFEKHRLLAGSMQEFVYTGKAGCDSIVQVRVHSLPPLEVDTYTETICWNAKNGAIELANPRGGIAPYRYSINKRNYQNASRFDNLQGGIYTIYIKDSEGCFDSTIVEIPVIEPMRYRVEDRILPCDQDSIELKVELFSTPENVKFQWPNGSTADNFKVGKPDIYWVKLENECESNFEEILVGLGEKQDHAYLYFPNAFSPNGDGYNDSYRTYPATGASVLHFEINIFDRNGKLVFHSQNYDEGWDGSYLGQSVESGAYFWSAKAVVAYCYREVIIAKEGTLVLLR